MSLIAFVAVISVLVGFGLGISNRQKPTYYPPNTPSFNNMYSYPMQQYESQRFVPYPNNPNKNDSASAFFYTVIFLVLVIVFLYL
jgi:hypothetical protein